MTDLLAYRAPEKPALSRAARTAHYLAPALGTLGALFGARFGVSASVALYYIGDPTFAVRPALTLIASLLLLTASIVLIIGALRLRPGSR